MATPQLEPRSLSGKHVMITGVCGTVGQELVRQLLRNYGVRAVTGIDINETQLFLLDQEYAGRYSVDFRMCDIRNRDELCRRMRGVDIVFHTAAYKHVLMCERSPDEAILTNIIGVQNVIAAANEAGVELAVFTSSDKAVNPTNVMGSTKLTGERLMTAASYAAHETDGPVFASTRFGNVLGSRGSVIPLFHEQIRNGGPLTLTDASMTRFVMSLQDAIALVIDSALQVHGGEVLVTKMPAVKISDLATVMIREMAPIYGRRAADIEIQEIGAKPGEKFYEELMTSEETRRTIEVERYYVVQPALRRDDGGQEYPNVVRTTVANPYTSMDQLTMGQDELHALLHNNGLLERRAGSSE